MARLRKDAAKEALAREAAQYEKTLRANKRIVPAGTPLPPGATHVEKRDDKGNVVLQRKRFSAI